MKLAFAGKGGTGKTALAATMARVLAAGGRRVLAVDLDVNPGLDRALGRLDGDGRLPAEAVAERQDGQYGWGLRPGLAPAEAVDRHAATGPDGLRLVSLGVIDGAQHDLARTHFAVREVAAGFDEEGWDVLADVEAGTKDVYDGSYVAFADLLVVLTDGSDTANLTARRLVGILRRQGGPAPVLVANRCAGDDRVAAARTLAGELGVRFAGEVPQDEAVRRADAAGQAVYDYAPGSDAVGAVRALAASLRSIVTEAET